MQKKPLQQQQVSSKALTAADKIKARFEKLRLHIELDSEEIQKNSQKLDESTLDQLVSIKKAILVSDINCIERGSKLSKWEIKSSCLRYIKITLGSFFKIIIKQINEKFGKMIILEGILIQASEEFILLSSKNEYHPDECKQQMYLIEYPDLNMMKKCEKGLDSINLILENEKDPKHDLCKMIMGEEFPKEEVKIDTSTKVNSEFNDKQKQAVVGALSTNSFFCILGPPGAGKSHVLLEIILILLLQKKKILYCATTHVSTDHMAKRFLNKEGVVARRYGPAYSVHEDLHPILMSNYPKEEPESIDIVFSTINGCFIKRKEFNFDYVLIDEAAQSPEITTWFPILLGKKVIMAGDFYQIPPYTNSNEAIKAGFQISLMERLYNSAPGTHKKFLSIQYRMNEAINAFPSSEFYKGKLEPADEVKKRNLRELRKKNCKFIKDPDFVFIDSKWHEEKLDSFNSFYNPHEAEIVVKSIKDLLASYDLDEADIGVISPYKGQCDYISLLLAKIGIKDVFVSTVDSFQGNEREVILISMVRCNMDGNLGFISNKQRLNVALTRARRSLFVIGSRDMLLTNYIFKNMLNTKSIQKC